MPEIDKKRAIELIVRMVRAEVTLMKQVNTARGVTKRADAEERKAAALLFEGLTGVEPSEDEITNMVNF